MPAVTYEPLAGEHIEHACRQAISHARASRTTCDFTFNGVSLTATPNSNQTDLVAEFDAELKRRSDAYWTPERIAERDAEIEGDRDRLSAHVATLASLDWDDLPSVCDWLCEFEQRKFVHTPCDSAAILSAFATHGLAPCMCQSDDGESVAEWSARTSTPDKWRYLIGQGLDCIAKVGAPHQIIHTFAERLRKEEL